MVRASTALLVAATASAQAIVAPRVGGMIFSGPAEPHVAALYWNPAAIGPLRGFRAYLDGALRIDTGTLTRDAIDTATGEPATAGTPNARRRAFAAAETHDFAPDLFGGLTWDLQSKRVVAGIAAYAPYAEFLHAGADWPGRYYRTRLDWYHAYLTPAVAFRLRDDLFFGLSLSFVFSHLSLAFERDTALDLPSAAAAEHESDALRESLAINVDAGPQFTFGLGWLWRPTSQFDFGIAWLRPPLGGSSTGLVRGEGEATAGGPVHEEGLIEGRASASWKLPDVVMMGVDWRPLERWQFGLWGRWSNWSVQEDLTVGLSSRAFDEATPPVPGTIVFWRGLHDTFALAGTAARRFGERFRAIGSVMLETAAVAESSVNPAAVDGPKLDAFLAGEIEVMPSLKVHLGYGATVMRDRELSNSDFDPAAAAACVDSGYDVDNPGCAVQTAGRALPSAQGTYRRVAHRVGVGVAFTYDPRHP